MVDHWDGQKRTKTELSKEKIKLLELKSIEEVLEYGSSSEELKAYIEQQEHLNSLKTKIIENELKRYLVNPTEEMKRKGVMRRFKVNGKIIGFLEIPFSTRDDRYTYTDILKVDEFKNIMISAGKKYFSYAFQGKDNELFINAFYYINEHGGTYEDNSKTRTIKIKIPKK